MRERELLLETDITTLRRPRESARGLRYWTRAELSSQVLFIVDGRDEDDVQARRFVMTNFAEVLAVCRGWSPDRVDVKLYAQTRDETAPYVFGRVEAVFGSRPTSSLFIKLDAQGFVHLPGNDEQRCDRANRLFPMNPSPI